MKALSRLSRRTGDGGRALFLSFGASAAIQLMNILTGILLARTLGPEGRGELTAVLLWPMILVTLGSLGVVEASTYYSARRTSALGAMVGTCIALTLVQSALAVAVGAVVLPIVLSNHDSSTVYAAYIFLAYVPLSMLMFVLMGIINGLQRFSWFHALRVCVIALTAVSLLALALAGVLTIRNAVYSYIAANLVTVLVAGMLVSRIEPVRLRLSGRLVRELLSFGLKSHLSTLSWMMNERLDQLVISIFLAPIKLGLYVIAVTLTSVPMLVGSSVTMVALPALARLQPGPERTAAARRFVVLTLVASTFVALPMIATAPALIRVVFGEGFVDAANVSRVLLLAAILLSTSYTLGAVLRGIGRPLDVGIAQALALAVTVGVLAVLLPALGLMGAAAASLLAYTVSVVWMARQAMRELGLSLTGLLLPTRVDLAGIRNSLLAGRSLR